MHNHADHDDATAPPTFGPFDQAFWDGLYGSHDALWSGRPNSALVAETAHLAAGRALDIGAGEGADAIWLASRGWRVTAVDLSEVALERAADHAAQSGVATQIEWLHRDVTQWNPEVSSFDLVAAHYFHLAPDTRRILFGRLASAVAAGGTLLVVAHDPAARPGKQMMPDDFRYSGNDVVAGLDPMQWDIMTNAIVPSGLAGSERPPDVVVRAQRHRV
jgi:SAM-dependent methyltransferase